jgi:hypothetical protein
MDIPNDRDRLTKKIVNGKQAHHAMAVFIFKLKSELLIPEGVVLLAASLSNEGKTFLVTKLKTQICRINCGIKYLVWSPSKTTAFGFVQLVNSS